MEYNRKGSYTEIVAKKIDELGMRKATDFQKNIIEKYLENNKDKQYGIINDILFIFYKNEIYCRSLPFMCEGEEILTRKNRWRTVTEWSKAEKNDIYSGIHIFLDENLSKEVSSVAKERATYKRFEHRKGDDFNDARRVETGNSGEMAFETFSSTKSTDFSSASSNSAEFEVVDNNELNLGVKSGRAHLATQVVKLSTRENELLMVVAREDATACRNGKHIICRGVVNDYTLHNKKYLTRNVLIDDGLLAKSIFFPEKMGAMFKQECLSLFYGLNEINYNFKNKKTYIGKNLVIDKAVDFSSLTPEFINRFERETAGANTSIIYIDVTSLGFCNYNDFVNRYLTIENKQISSLEKFASERGIGVVFYDENTVWNYKTKNCLSYKIDKYLVGKLFADGSMISATRKKK